MTRGCVQAADGEWLHEEEATWDEITGQAKRDPDGHHVAPNGLCDCSFVCCMVGDTQPYICVCDECAGCTRDGVVCERTLQ